MDSVVDSLFRNTNSLLRNFLAGFVALAVAWAVDGTHTVLADMQASATSWWPILLLAPVIGISIYSVHLAVYWPTLGFLLFWAAHRWTTESSPVGLAEAQKRYREDDEHPWGRRLSSDPKQRANQALLDAWGANIHFRYCSVVAVLCTPLVLGAMGREVAYFYPVTIAVVVCVLNAIDDFRLELRYIAASKGQQEHVRQAGEPPAAGAV